MGEALITRITREEFDCMAAAEKIAAMQQAGALAPSPDLATPQRPYYGRMRRREGVAYGFVGNVFIPPRLASPAGNVGRKIEDGDPVLIENVERTEKGLRATSAAYGDTFLLEGMFAETLPDGARTPRPYDGDTVAVPETKKWRSENLPFSDRTHCRRQLSPLPGNVPVTHVPAGWTGDLNDYVVIQKLEDVPGIPGDFSAWQRSDKPLLAEKFVVCTFRSESVIVHPIIWDDDDESEKAASWVTCVLPSAAAQSLGIPASLEDAFEAFAGKPRALWAWLVKAEARSADVPMALRPALAGALGATWGGEDLPHVFAFAENSPFEGLYLQKDSVPSLYERDGNGGRRAILPQEAHR